MRLLLIPHGGFMRCLVAIENGFSDPVTGQLLLVDGIFHRL